MEITHQSLIESHLYLDLSESLLNKVDLFLSNVNLSKKQEEELVKLFQILYSESYVNALSD